MLRKRQGDKGFSLIELIVVVLIIAIIAVALSPQVIKWVDNARKSVQENDMGSIKTCFDVAVAEYIANGGTLSEDAIFYIRDKKLWDSTNAVEADLSEGTLAYLVDQTMKNDYPEVIKPNGNKFKITVNQDLNTVNVELVE